MSLKEDIMCVQENQKTIQQPTSETSTAIPDTRKKRRRRLAGW